MSGSASCVIPPALDDAGLTPAQFRVYAHLSRCGAEGSCPGIEAIAKVCCLHKETVILAIRELEKLRFVAPVRTPGERTRYVVKDGSETGPKTVAADQGDQSEMGNGVSEMGNGSGPVGNGERVVGNGERVVGNGERVVGNGERFDPDFEGTVQVLKVLREVPPPKKVRPEPKKSADPRSPEAYQFADEFRASLPADFRLSPGWREAWAKCYDDMIRLDKRTPESIAGVTKWARASDFWGSNFLSPAKLRTRNRDGILFFDVFTEQMRCRPRNESPAQRAARHETEQFPLRAEEKLRIWDPMAEPLEGEA